MINISFWSCNYDIGTSYHRQVTESSDAILLFPATKLPPKNEVDCSRETGNILC